MYFSEFSTHLLKLEQTDSRLEMMYQLANLYSLLDGKEVVQASYLMQGSLVPVYLSLEFQLSVKMVVRSLGQLVTQNSIVLEDQTEHQQQGVGLFDQISEVTTVNEVLLQRYKQLGDIGTLTEQIVSLLREKNGQEGKLTIQHVFQHLTEIAQDEGSGSQERKVGSLVKLFSQLDPISAKFVARIIIGKLRLGFSTMTILDALSWSVVGSKDHRKVLELAYQRRADVGELAALYLDLAKSIHADTKEEKYDLLAQQIQKDYSLRVGIPVVPALCQRLNTSVEIIEKMKTVYAEPKYDGLRLQIHYSKNGFTDAMGAVFHVDGEVQVIRAFSRNLEEVTHMFPELNQIAQQLNCESCILDAEAIAYDPTTNKLLPFQETITRKRKHEVTTVAQKTPIRMYVFDCLFLDARSLISVKLRERKDLLKGLFKDTEQLSITTFIVSSDANELRTYHTQQLAQGLEGAVMKKLDSEYQSGRRGYSWVKIKEEEGQSGKLKDTLDLVIMGYYFGRGKRSSFGIGAFLAGIVNDKQEIRTIAKVGTGISDEQLSDLKSRVDALTVTQMPKEYVVEKTLYPDVWILPEIVVEIAADEITQSPNHSAGVALRFPRLVKFRDDKNVSDATTLRELKNF